MQSKLVGQLLDGNTPNLYVFIKLLLPNKKIDKRKYHMGDIALFRVMGKVLGVGYERLKQDNEKGPHAGITSDVIMDAYASRCVRVCAGVP